MATCVHCGMPAGAFRRHHPECQARYDFAVKAIPTFFEKALHSSLPADRFDQLLQEAAAASHLKPEQLRGLAVSGVAAMVDFALATHLPTPFEEDRIVEIANAVGLTLDAVPVADDKLIKASILRELALGQIPNRVTVAGSLPVDLVPDEDIIWIFNQIKPHRSPPSKESTPQLHPLPAIADLPDYYSPLTLAQDQGYTKAFVEGPVGDLIVTTEQLVIVQKERTRSIPYDRITGFGARHDGILIARRPSDSRIILLMVDDVWFATNLVSQLLRLKATVEAG
jgi:hypothetical protein